MGRNDLPCMNPKPRPTRLLTPTRAFSLVEMLVVIAVIGVIAAIAIPMIQTISGDSDDVKDRRNAQNIAQVSSALKNLGVNHVLAESDGGIEATTDLLREGITVPKGPFKGEMFAVRALDEDAIDGASRFLEIVDRSGDLWLVYSGPEE